jgi:hypothetical protein
LLLQSASEVESDYRELPETLTSQAMTQMNSDQFYEAMQGMILQLQETPGLCEVL